MVKNFTEQQINDIIKLKFGRLVDSAQHVGYASNATLGKIFGVSAGKIRELYTARFQAIEDKKQPFLQQFTKMMQRYPRKRWGLRFLR